MDRPDKCLYCQVIIDCDDFLNCQSCKENIHVKCLKRPGTPGDLLGDVFFTFTCTNCATDGKEVFLRQKLPWLMVITLAIYNLSIQSKGLSHHGYFHWRTHITHFIDKNWNFLFEPTMKRKKKWTGTVSGALSHNSPDFFTSGQEFFHDSGWWKLTYNQTPKFYWKLYEQLSLKKQQLRNDRRNFEEGRNTELTIIEELKRARNDKGDNEPFSRTLPYMGRTPKKLKRKSESEGNMSLNMVQSSLADFLAANLSSGELLENLPQMTQKDLLPLMSPTDHDNRISDLWNPESPNLEYEQDFKISSDVQDNYSHEQSPTQRNLDNANNDNNKFIPRIVQVTNYQQFKDISEKSNGISTNIKRETQDSSSESEENFEFTCEKSLFTITPKRDYPWNDEKEEEDVNQKNYEEQYGGRIEQMSEYEEKELLKQLSSILALEKYNNFDVPLKVRRIFRKLSVRQLKRNNFKKLFDIDTYGKKCRPNEVKPHILDRYYQVLSVSNSEECSFHSRIIGCVQYEIFESPFTSRILHPFIYRNSKCFPKWVKLMCELQHTVTGEVPSRATIDFCYVRPYHIAAINSLLQQTFWPGIDMSECLTYPDFSVIALYKKLVVGCAFLVPDVGYNEAYISFMAVRPGWKRCGIASFMLYHLTQTCMGKDITLHVSASNPAICLYQKFGFKIEEVILDFYDKYLPPESNQSRHAFLLRMTR